MSDTKSRFSAIISIAGAMDSSVKSAFGGTKKEADKLGVALLGLKQKQQKLLQFGKQSAGVATAEAALKKQMKLAADARKAMLAAPNNAKATKEFERQQAAVDKARAAVVKEREALDKLDDGLRKTGINSKLLSSESEKLARQIERTQARIGRREWLNKAGSNFMKFSGIVAAASAAVVAPLTMVERNIAQNAHDLESVAKGVGIATDYLQAYRKMAASAGIDAEKADSVIFKTTRAIERAQKGKGREWDALKELRLNVTALRAMKPEHQLEIVANAIENYKGKANKAVLFGVLGGKDANVARFAGAIRGGAKEIEKIKAQGLKTHLFLSNDDIAKAEQFRLAQKAISNSSIMLKNTIGISLMPTFTRFFSAIAKIVEDNLPAIEKFAADVGRSLESWMAVGGVEKTMRDLGSTVSVVCSTLGFLVNKFGGVQVVGVALGAALLSGPVASVLALTIGAARLFPVIGKVGSSCWGVLAAVGPLGWAVTAAVASVGLLAYTIYNNWGPLKDFTSTLWSGICAQVGDAFGILKGSVSAYFDFFRGVWTGNFDAFKKDIDGVVQHFASAFSRIGDTFSVVRNAFKSDSTLKQENDDYVAKVKAMNDQAAQRRATKTSGILRDNRPLPALPRISGAPGGSKVDSHNTYHITVTSQPGQEAATAAEVKTRLENQEPAIAGGALHD